MVLTLHTSLRHVCSGSVHEPGMLAPVASGRSPLALRLLGPNYLESLAKLLEVRHLGLGLNFLEIRVKG